MSNATAGKFGRRAMIERLMAGVAAGAAWPGMMLAAGNPIFGHAGDGGLLARADAMAEAVDWKPLFLSAAQNAELVRLAEGIVPGSTRAEVNRFVDLLLSVDTAEKQREFTGALGKMDAEARKLFGRGAAQLNAREMDALLTRVSGGGGEGAKERAEFKVVKEWVVGAFYSSEMGMRELGWDGTVAFAEYPVCGGGKEGKGEEQEQKN